LYEERFIKNYVLSLQTGSYNDIDIDVPVKNFIGDSIEYDDMNNVNMFHKPEKSDKTLNELDKIPSTSKNDNMLNHQLKSSVSNNHNVKYI
jgi:hypothetical protein